MSRTTLAAVAGAVLLAACRSVAPSDGASPNAVAATPTDLASSSAPTASEATGSEATASEATAAVVVEDQPPGDRIVAAEVTVDADAFVVVHRDLDGAPGTVIGHASVGPGTASGIEVVLDEPVVAGDVLWAMLHTDEGAVGTYEFPGPDVPLRDAADAVVMVPFEITES